MGGCQNYGSFLGTLNIRCRIIIGTQRGTIILTTTQYGLFGFVSVTGLHRAWDLGSKISSSSSAG